MREEGKERNLGKVSGKGVGEERKEGQRMPIKRSPLM